MSFQIVKLIDPPIDLSVNVSPQGAYDNSTSYTVGQSVSYNGSSFVAKQTTVGNLPTDTTYWQLLASKGDDGPTGSTGPAGADGVVQSIVAGTNVTIDSTDPANPIVNASGGGGGLNVGLAIAVQNGNLIL